MILFRQQAGSDHFLCCPSIKAGSHINEQFKKFMEAPLRYMVIRITLSLLLAVSVVGQVQAGLFSGGGEEKVDQLTPDATFTLTFLNRSSLGFDPSLLRIRAVYQASKPDEKGVRRETRKTYSSPKIPVPFGGSTQKYQVVVERTAMLPSSWISSDGATSIAIRVPEFLSGPGAYRLAKLDLPCFDELCARDTSHNGSVELNLHMRSEPASKMAKFIHLSTTLASSVVTAAYEGRELDLAPSEGSQSAFAYSFNKKEAQALRAVQDASGRWHISPNALIMLFQGYDSYEDPWMDDEELWVKANQYPSLAWAIRFKHVAHSTVYDSPQLNQLGEMKPVHPGNWTGCVSIKGKNADADEEIRYYGFNEGRLIFRRLRRYDGRVSLDERIELDGNKRPLFVERTEYQHRSMKEKNLRWSRLVEEALPNTTQDTMPVDVAALLREGEDVKKVIAHSFTHAE
jgi:hypothetical protein